MSQSRVIAVGLLIVVAALSGCSGESSKAVTATATSSPTETASPTPTAAHVPKVTLDSPAKPPAQDGTVSITKSTIFSSGVVDILNAFDLGNSTTQLTICRDVSAVLDGMTDSQMSSQASAMKDYDYSTLTDLVAECNALIN